MPEQLQTKCDSCATLEADVLDIHSRLQKLEHSHGRMQEAFVKNDLGLPDFDGHRTDHKVRIEESKVVDGYKRDATKRFIDLLIGGGVAVFLLGLVEWVRSHLK